jgi:hypothetical protein
MHKYRSVYIGNIYSWNEGKINNKLETLSKLQCLGAVVKSGNEVPDE